jgi:hypothetical protein
MGEIDGAIILLGIAGICVLGAKYLIDEQKKALTNRRCVCR